MPQRLDDEQPLINIDTTAKAVAKQLERIPARQLPFAQSLIANRMAQQVKKAELSVMGARFDQPTRWTMNSLYIKAATKRDPSARVWFKDKAPGAGAVPANTYLQAEVFGGRRSAKGIEKAMQSLGLISAGQFLVPAQGAKLDAHGNMRRSQVRQILAAFRSQNVKRYWFGKVSDEGGIWERVNSAFGEGLRPIMIVTDQAPAYRVRFPFFAVANNTVKANYERVATKAIDEALRTARP